ncbi:TonB-dependent receptor [Membranicola marinus]|uniref:TonB-dependent receptor n=1 Tax=Membranihabitans marinus TaxID=1227546 RepID=A0A953L8F5_9BACT|nr:TonB-dependent receptor [Membranihabitans marinus]MBY5957630.1 TonB-dependent receptor [Membranihabitans marinus]
MKRLLLLVAFLGFLSFTVEAQKTITGTVEDIEGDPLIGATVQVVGHPSVGTVTDFDGIFEIQLPDGANEIRISYVGFIAETVTIEDGETNVTIVMNSDSQLLDEVVVVAYGTSTKGSFTGSVGEVDRDLLEKRQVSNISNALTGAVAGVQVQNSNGQPGTSAKIKVRGIGSINAGSDPLYVVDGIPYDGDLASINSSDIESMVVLKDAASTALYGSRGANGIIMITTKKGSSGEAKIRFDIKGGVNSRAVRNYDVLTSPQNYSELAYRAIYNAGIYNLGYDPYQANAYANQKLVTNTEGGHGYQIYTVPQNEVLIGTNGKLNPNATLGYSDGTYYFTPDSWADETFQNNPRQDYNLSVSGGTDKQNYYLSFNYMDDQGVIPGSGFKRFSGRFNGEQKVKDWLKVGANVNYNQIDSDYPGEQVTTNSSANAFFVSNYIAPVYPIYVRDAETQAILRNQGRKIYDYGDGKSTPFSRSFMQIANPAGDLTFDKTDYLKDIVNSSFFAELNPIQGLRVTAKYGMNVGNTQYKNLGNAYMGQSASYGGTAYQDQTRIWGIDQQYIAFYEFNINRRHQFDVTAGYDGYSYTEENVFASGQNLYNPEINYVDNAIDNLRGGGEKDFYTTKGILGRLNYGLDDTYFANIAYRRDASSRFSPENRWGNFWSASAAWILTNESFLAGNSTINMLKLKASYGEQGNDDIGNYYAWLDQYQVTGAEGVFSDGTLIYKGNPDLTWETSTSYNIGLDFGLFRHALTGSIEYFGRKSVDMLYNKPVAGSLGYTSIPLNVGSMTNSGLEVDLGWNIISSDNIRWSLSANATAIKNKINELHKDLDGELIDGTRIYSEGESMYRMYLVDYAGVDPETGMAQYWAQDENEGMIKTSDYAVAQSYKVATDDLLPKVYGGFGTNLEAYGFDASVLFSYQLGGQIYDSGYRRLMHSGSSSFAGNNWHKDIYNAWTPDNPNSDIPRLNANDRYANSTSTRFLVSSDYLSLNNVTVGYTLPSRVMDAMKIEKLRLYFAADNLALLASRTGLDPRQSYTSATTARYTPIRTISGGINLTF